MAQRANTARPATQPVLVKRYANRRLYDTVATRYVTPDELAAMVRSGRDVVVREAESGADITQEVLSTR